MKNIAPPRLLLWVLPIILTTGFLVVIVPPVVEHVVNWRAVMAEHSAIQRMVTGWRDRPPRGVAEDDWERACETLLIAIKNVFLPNLVSLEEARAFRAEVEQRDKRPVTPETLDWFLLRLGETGPRPADYLSRNETWWEPTVIRVRATGGDPELATVYAQLAEWHERPPPRESSLPWYWAVNGLQAAVVRVYDVPCEDTRDELRGLSGYIESLSAEPITAETLRRLADHLADSTPRGAEYMRRTDYLKNRFDFLDRTRRGSSD